MEIKKKPAYEYEKITGRHPFVGLTAPGSQQRFQSWLTNGCNTFHTKRPASHPLMPWTEENIWGYLRGTNPECKPISYSPIYDMGYDRTGCMFCGFGVHLEKGENRFQRMKRTHPKIWEYCVFDLGIGNAMATINVDVGLQSDLYVPKIALAAGGR